MKIAILTRPDNRSPKILAESLKCQLKTLGVFAEVFEDIDLLNNLVSYGESKLSLHFWLNKKVTNYSKYSRLLKRLKQFDAIVISEYSPNSFLRRFYNVERFKKLIKKPVLFYEVYYLGNAPHQMELLKKNEDALLDRYDYYLSVSRLTEIKLPLSDKWFSIGIYARLWKLFPSAKKEIIAIIDFLHPGNERYRQIQIKALQKVGIKYISLEKPYTIEEIRNIYRQGSIYFMQSSEAFGLPVLECLCCGNQVFTPFSRWPMSWRLNENPGIHEDGILPECFTVYGDREELIKELEKFKTTFDYTNTPQKIFQNFIKTYPTFYNGNETELKRILKIIESRIEQKV